MQLFCFEVVHVAVLFHLSYLYKKATQLKNFMFSKNIVHILAPQSEVLNGAIA